MLVNLAAAHVCGRRRTRVPVGDDRCSRILRLETVHPLLVHCTVGALPLLLIAYGVAFFQRSARWTFVGDVVLIVTAALTLFTTAFGLVSNALVQWPGGLGTWRYLHLGLGIASTVLLVGFAIGRLVARRREQLEHTAGGAFLLAILTTLLVGSAGWIGGEVLVYHAGMAVRAAGDGALAPPVLREQSNPKDLMDGMGRIRASFASADVTLAMMMVHHPSHAGFRRVATNAQDLGQLALWMKRAGARTLDKPNAPYTPPAGADAGHAPAAADPPGGDPPHQAPAGAAKTTRAEHLAQAAEELSREATALTQAAQAEDLAQATTVVGRIRNAVR